MEVRDGFQVCGESPAFFFNIFFFKLKYTISIFVKIDLQKVSGGTVGEESACIAGDPGSILGLGRPPGDGHGDPLQYSCLDNSMDREAWTSTVHGIAKTWSYEHLISFHVKEISLL